jgi:phage portal protein BeeE
VGLLRYLRGDDVLEDSSSNGNDESRSLPPPKNQLPLWVSRRSFRDPSYWKLSPVDALAVADCWAAVRVLSDAVSSVPLHVYRKTETGRQRVTSEKLVDLLERPSPGVTEADLTSSLMCHLAVWGNAFLAKYRQDGEVVQLGLLHPDRIRPELEDGKLKWRYSPPKGPQQMLTEADVVHVKGLSTDSLNGLSAVSQAARVLGLSDSLVKHAMSFFESKTQRPAGVLRLGDPEQFPNAPIARTARPSNSRTNLSHTGFWWLRAIWSIRTLLTRWMTASLSSSVGWLARKSHVSSQFRATCSTLALAATR